MGRIAIFTDDPGWHGARLRQAFTARGYSSDYVSLIDCRIQINSGRLPILVPGFESRLPDGVFVRGVPGGSLEEVVFYLDILHALKKLGVAVYNDGRAVERTVDKAMTSLLLQQAGIPTPPTWVIRNELEAKKLAEQELNQGRYLVSKPLFGSQGEGIQRLESLQDVEELSSCHGIYYLQHFISCGHQSSYDWRVFVINGKAIAAMRRCGSTWLNNVAQGARCEIAYLEGPLVHLAERAVNVLNMNYGGVDIIRDEQGNYCVIEVNSVPAWKGLQSVSDVTIADLLADDFLTRCTPCQFKEVAVS